jgi:hypothetical protein
MRDTLLSLCVVVVACASPRQPAGVQPTGGAQEEQLGRMPLGPAERARLRALPQVSTYRWGTPSAHFRGLSAAEDSMASTFNARDLRDFGASVLRANGWYAAGDSVAPLYELSIVSFERPMQQLTQREQTPPQLRPEEWSRCRRLPAAQRANCVEPPPPPSPQPQLVRTMGAHRFFAFAIVRLSDSATAWWIVPRREDLLTLQMQLLAAPPEM